MNDPACESRRLSGEPDAACGGAPANEAGRGGDPSGGGAELACIILSLATPPSLVAAVRSLLEQDRSVEIVVVNSGGGEPESALRAAGIEGCAVVDHASRLYPGSARNLGIMASRAPYVAFLASDCLAEPGWVAARMQQHHSGWHAVSSAVTNHQKTNLWAWVSHITLFSRRMPGTPSEHVLHYGVSYDRRLFDRFGLFREELRAGEDSELNSRLAASAVPIAWAPEVRSAHLHPVTLCELFRDQAARGRRMASVRRQLSGRREAVRVAFNAVTRLPSSIHLAWMSTRGTERRFVAAAALLSPIAALAYALGALTARAVTPPAPALPRRRRRILAVLAFHNEIEYLPDYFANVAPQVDGIVALDDGSSDGSAELVNRQPSVLRLIRLPVRSPHVWDEPRNRRLLVQAAWEHGAEWIVAVDADERLEQGFRERADAEIARAESSGHLAYRIVLRELWNHPDRYRADGIWGQKRPVRFFKARADHEHDPRRLHGFWAPLNSLRDGDFPEADLTVYHLKMVRREDRAARRARYERLDPNRECQEMGYAYMTDETGLVLEPLAKGREY